MHTYAPSLKVQSNPTLLLPQSFFCCPIEADLVLNSVCYSSLPHTHPSLDTLPINTAGVVDQSEVV